MEVLRIVELEARVPQYFVKEVKEVVSQIQERIVENTVIQTVDKEKIVYLTKETEVIKQVEVERQVPFEIIKERDVPVI